MEKTEIDAEEVDREPYVHPAYGRATVPHTGIGWKYEPREGGDQ